jgi:hypothetical protein
MDTQSISKYNNYIINLFNYIIENNNIDKFNRDGGSIIPKVSFPKSYDSANTIKNFFNSPEKIIDYYADSSGGMTIHMIFRKNKKVFIGFKSSCYDGIKCVYEIDRSFINYIDPDFLSNY